MDALNEASVRHEIIEVPRSARVCVAGGQGLGGPKELWLACHGYRQLAHRFIRRLLPIASTDRMIVAPEGLSRFYLDSDGGRHGAEARVGASWMTREDRENEISDYVRYLDRVHAQFSPTAVESKRIAFGFSQGVHTATRWSVMGSTAIDRLILWGAYVPPDLDLNRYGERWRRLRVTQVHGESDPSRSDRLAADQAERLAAAGLDIEIRTHEGGHRVDLALLSELAAET